MDAAQFRDTLRALEPQEFCRRHLFSADAWIFSDASLGLKGTYADFRKTIGDIVNEPETNVAIVGSSKFGFSMNPNSAYAPFHSDSDVDIVIISQSLFMSIWLAYREAYYNGYSNVIRFHSRNVFRNFVVVPAIEYQEFKTVYLRKIWLKMQKMKRDLQVHHRISIEINFRIYSTWTDAEAYHSSGLKRLKEVLI